MKIILLLFVLTVSTNTYCQSNIALQQKEAEVIQLIKQEDSIAQKTQKPPFNKAKRMIQNKLMDLLSLPGANTYSFDDLKQAFPYELRCFDLQAGSLRVFQLFRFFNNFPDGDYNAISLIQFRNKNGNTKVFPLSDHKPLFAEGLFYKDIAFEILEIDTVKSKRGNLFLLRAHQGNMIERQSVQRLIYFFIQYTGDHIILDKPIYKNSPFLSITTTESNYLGDIQTHFRDSIPYIRAFIPINSITRENKFLSKKDKDAADITFKFNGHVFTRVNERFDFYTY